MRAMHGIPQAHCHCGTSSITSWALMLSPYQTQFSSSSHGWPTRAAGWQLSIVKISVAPKWRLSLPVQLTKVSSQLKEKTQCNSLYSCEQNKCLLNYCQCRGCSKNIALWDFRGLLQRSQHHTKIKTVSSQRLCRKTVLKDECRGWQNSTAGERSCEL